MKQLSKCPFGAKKCFAYDSMTGFCTALENTQFDPRRGCRFYKTQAQQHKDAEAAKKRNEKLGIRMDAKI